MSGELKGISPIQLWLRHNVASPHEPTPQRRTSDLLSRKAQFQCRLTPAASTLSVAAETKRGDSGSLRSQGLEEAALGRPGGQP